MKLEVGKQVSSNKLDVINKFLKVKSSSVSSDSTEPLSHISECIINHSIQNQARRFWGQGIPLVFCTECTGHSWLQQISTWSKLFWCSRKSPAGHECKTSNSGRHKIV